MATQTSQDRPRGVFVLKKRVCHEVLRTICTLDRFFNKGPKYAIRIFADEQVSESTILKLKKINPLVDLQVIVDEVKWRQLPDEFFLQLNLARSISYPSVMSIWDIEGIVEWLTKNHLQDFDYFITLDGDAYLTRPWEVDPFQLLHDNNLTGFFPTDFTNYGFDDGIEETAYAVFGKSLEGRGYLNSNDTFPLFQS